MNDHRSSLFCTALGFTTRLSHVAAYPWARGSPSNRKHAKDTGLAASLISKMRSSLSMRGMIHR
jgi:hypothetical protein